MYRNQIRTRYLKICKTAIVHFVRILSTYVTTSNSFQKNEYYNILRENDGVSIWKKQKRLYRQRTHLKEEKKKLDNIVFMVTWRLKKKKNSNSTIFTANRVGEHI